MYKFWISIKKEYLQLFGDKVGLSLMFLMPLMLVLIITIIQNSAFKAVNENKISMLIVNNDNGEVSHKFIDLLEKTLMFDIEIDTISSKSEIKIQLLKKSKQTALYIPKNFTQSIKKKAEIISKSMLNDLGVEDTTVNNLQIKSGELDFFHDPVLQDNYCYSLMGIIYSNLDILENSLMIETVYAETGMGTKPDKLKEKMLAGRIKITKTAATNKNFNIIPNSTQHNVPAWTIFAMFFMVVSLGSNIVKERNSGSFIRLKTMPVSFSLVIISKMLVYVSVGIMQVFIIFSVGIYIFPHINLPELVLPNNLVIFTIFVILISLTAVSYAVMIGTIARTQEQANGFGAISIIIFAALGGIWVPTFVMPEYMQTISNISPLHWGLEGFYVLFLKGGNWSELSKIMLFLSIFIIITQIVTYYKLKVDKIV